MQLFFGRLPLPEGRRGIIPTVSAFPVSTGKTWSRLHSGVKWKNEMIKVVKIIKKYFFNAEADDICNEIVWINKVL